MIIQLYEVQHGPNYHKGDLFTVNNDVKHGCFLAPSPVTIFFNIMLKQAKKDRGDWDGIFIRYSLNVGLFKLR